MQKISIIIPAYNEAATLAEIVRRVEAVNLAPLEREIIIVDNNSTDETYAIATALPGVRVLQESTPGKGAAVRTGFREATGDILLIQDADLEYDPSDYPELIRPIIERKTQIVLGLRTYPEDQKPNRGVLYLAGNLAITLATNILYVAGAKEYTGGYKLFTKEAIKSVEVKSHDFAYEHELVCKLLKKGHRTVGVPIRYSRREYADGKKLAWHDGFKILWAIIKYRFVD